MARFNLSWKASIRKISHHLITNKKIDLQLSLFKFHCERSWGLSNQIVCFQLKTLLWKYASSQIQVLRIWYYFLKLPIIRFLGNFLFLVAYDCKLLKLTYWWRRIKRVGQVFGSLSCLHYRKLVHLYSCQGSIKLSFSFIVQTLLCMIPKEHKTHCSLRLCTCDNLKFFPAYFLLQKM